MSRYRNDGSRAEEGSSSAKGATVGGLVGAGTGLLVALGMIAIPGIGPLLAAGVLSTTLTAAVAGGVIGALVDYGVSENDAHVYSEAVRRGSSLVLMPGLPKSGKFSTSGARSTSTAVGTTTPKRGWSNYDPAAPGYTAEQIRKEREMYGPQR